MGTAKTLRKDAFSGFDLGRVMKVKRWWILLTAGGMVLAGVVAVLLWPRKKEPEYQGKKLSEWLGVYLRDETQHEQAAMAVRQIGTNALPLLVRWVETETPAWRKRATWIYDHKFPRWTRSKRVFELLLADKLRASHAVCGFRILGPDARPAIPTLLRTMDPNNGENLSRRMFCFKAMGKAGINPLLAVFLNAPEGKEKMMAERLLRGIWPEPKINP